MLSYKWTLRPRQKSGRATIYLV